MLENYEKLKNGVIRQVKCEPFNYDHEYADSYNKLGELGIRMGHLRLGHIIGSLGKIPSSILDIGYGNGDFLSACSNIIPECYGSDITNYPIPKKCKFIEDFSKIKVEVTTMYDVLEHLPNIYDISKINTKYLVVSVPFCHYFNDAWFLEWKHRKPNEHLWHFNENSLISFMEEVGYSVKNTTCLEDTIRKNNCEYSNILTGVFENLNYENC